MSSRIVQYFKDKTKQIKEYPKTITRAIFSDDGERLDETLNNIKDKLGKGEARNISFSPTTKVESTTVQDAITELANRQTESATATDISFAPTEYIKETNVQDALGNLDSNKIPTTINIIIDDEGHTQEVTMTSKEYDETMYNNMSAFANVYRLHIDDEGVNSEGNKIYHLTEDEKTKVGKDYIETSAIGAHSTTSAKGVAELDENGLILSSQLPSYVDDVIEYSSISAFPTIGESGKIYVDISTNLTYRWGGSEYVSINPSLALGETSSTAYRGDRGKIAYDHSQTANVHITDTERNTWNGKQDASTAINTSNIGNQSVSHASTADDATTVDGHTVKEDVPEGAVFTDTTYNVVTTETDGLMASTDKVGLDKVIEDVNVKNSIGNNLILDTSEGAIRFNEIIGNSHKSSNILKNSQTEIEQQGNVTLVNNNDGTFTINGSATNSNVFQIQYPRGILDGTYKIIGVPKNSNIQIEIYTLTGLKAIDTGDGAIFTFSQSVDREITNFLIKVTENTILNNVIIKPMLTTDTSITYDGFESYGVHNGGEKYGCARLEDYEWQYDGSNKRWRAMNSATLCPKIAVCKRGEISINDIVYMDYPHTDTVVIEGLHLFIYTEDSINPPNGLMTYKLANGAIPDNYAIVINEHGANLWDEQWEVGILGANGENSVSTTNIRSKNYIPVKSNTSYYVTALGETSVRIAQYTESKSFISYLGYFGNKTFQVADNCRYIRFWQAGNTSASYHKDIAIIEGTSGSYLPHKEKSSIIYLNSTPLCGINDIKEKIYKEDNVWKKDVKFNNVDLGTLNYVASTKNSQKIFVCTDNVIASQNDNNLLCNQYDSYGYSSINVSVDEKVSVDERGRIVFVDTKFSDATQFKNYLKDAGARLTYELAEPYTEILSDQKVLDSFETYEEKTYLSTIDKLVTLNVGYGTCDAVAIGLKNTKDIIDLKDDVNQNIEDITEDIYDLREDVDQNTKDIIDNTSIFNAIGTSIELENTFDGGIRLNEIVGKTLKSPNLFNPNLNTSTRNGITCTKNGDGTFTINGSTTDVIAQFNLLGVDTVRSFIIADGTYKVNGAPKGSGVQVIVWVNDAKVGKATDTGDGKTFTFSQATDKNISLFITIPKNTTVNNVIVKPMLTTDTSLTYNDYEPYGVHSVGDGYGCVDLGDLEWQYYQGAFLSTTLLSDLSEVRGADFACSLYENAGLVGLADMRDMTLELNKSSSNNVWIKNSNYTNASSFKSAMKNIFLAYKLADGAVPSNYAMVVKEHGFNYLENIVRTETSKVTVNYKPLSDGRYTLNGTPTINSVIIIKQDNMEDYHNPIMVLDGSNGSYVLRDCQLVGYWEDDTSSSHTYGKTTGNTSSAFSTTFGGHTFLVTGIRIYLNASVTYSENNVFEPMIYKGADTNHPFVPYNGKSFPIQLGSTPLCGIGSVEEKVFKQNGKFVRDKKYGLVKLKDLTYNQSESPKGFIITSNLDIRKDYLNYSVANVLCAKYSTVNYYGFSDGTITFFANTKAFYIRDERFSNVNEFVASLTDDDVLIYEKATPTIETLSNQLDCYEFESFVDKTYINTADGLALMNIDYGNSIITSTLLRANNKSSASEERLDVYDNYFATDLVYHGDFRGATADFDRTDIPVGTYSIPGTNSTQHHPASTQSYGVFTQYGDTYKTQMLILSPAGDKAEVKTYTRRYVLNSATWQPWTEMVTQITSPFIPTGSALSSYTAERCNYVKTGRLMHIDFQVWVKSGAGTGATNGQIIKFSDIGGFKPKNLVTSIAFTNDNNLVKVIANRDNGAIHLEALIGAFPSDLGVYGTLDYVIE